MGVNLLKATSGRRRALHVRAWAGGLAMLGGLLTVDPSAAEGVAESKAVFSGPQGLRMEATIGPRPKMAALPATPVMADATTGGISWWVELIDATGRGQRVPTTRVFHTSERVKLHFQLSASQPALLTVWGLGPTGLPNLLSSEAESRTPLAAGASVALPADGTSLLLDDHIGTETLLVLVSNELPPANRSAGWLSDLETATSKDLIRGEPADGLLGPETTPQAFRFETPLSRMQAGAAFRVTLQHAP